MMSQTKEWTDDELKSAVIDELERAPSVDATNIGVGVDDGAVTLSGGVGTYPERDQAARAAFRVRGVTAVAQEITVRSPLGPINDSDLAREAGNALSCADDVPDAARVR
jgi:osmotically-inducible protein OsmY